jgi:hypothetical protein
VLAVLSSGCGSTKTASTPTTTSTSKTASTNAGTTAPAGKGAQSATQSTSSKHAPPTTAPEAKPAREQKAAKVQAVKPTVESAEGVPPSHRFPRPVQVKFIASCGAAKGSNSSCECILTKLEQANVEKGQSIAELIALELELKNGVSLQEAPHHGAEPLPVRVKRDVEECTSK